MFRPDLISMECCIGIEQDLSKRKLKVIASTFSLIELVEFVRLICINEWLLTPRWDKAVLVELILLALLIVTNFLLYLGAVRRSSTELLAWLVSHSIFFVIQILLVVYFIVVIFIIASPQSQNSWLGLPEGMASNTSEFQQALRYHLGALLTKLLALFFICPLTGLSIRAVWREREAMETEVRDKQTKYQVKTEYREAQKLSTASSHHSIVSGGQGQQRRDSYGLYRDQMARRSLRRPASVSEGVYTIPQTEVTPLPPSHGQYNIGGPVTTGTRGPQGDLWSRQTSLDTSYNVPSIRTDMGDQDMRTARNIGGFDSIAEVTESGTEAGWRNRGYDL